LLDQRVAVLGRPADRPRQELERLSVEDGPVLPDDHSMAAKEVM
jgi:hypothetical protein